MVAPSLVASLAHAVHLEPAFALVPPWHAATLNGSERDVRSWPHQQLSRSAGSGSSSSGSDIAAAAREARERDLTRQRNRRRIANGATEEDLHPHHQVPLQRAFKRQAAESQYSGNSTDTTTVQWAFDHQGLLLHVIRPSDVERWQQGQKPWFSIDRDCGDSCSAWSLQRKDLPFIVFLKFDFNEPKGWGDQGIGYISDVVKLAPKIVAMAPVDSNSVNRQCCTPGDYWSRPAGFRDSHGESNAHYCPGSCPKGDRDCQAFRAGGAANIWDLMTWGEEGCGTASEIQDGKCDQCRLGHRGAPYWCDNSGIGVESAEDWMRLYGDDTSLRNFNTLIARQCKFRQEQWDTWIASIKLLHKTCLQNPGCPNYECCQAAVSKWGTIETYLENEVNLYFDPHEAKPDQELWTDSINGVFYLDMGDNKGAYKKTKARKLAAAMVQEYNEKHTKQIKLYRAIAELPGNVTRWQPNKWLNMSDFLIEVASSELEEILTRSSARTRRRSLRASPAIAHLNESAPTRRRSLRTPTPPVIARASPSPTAIE